MALNIINPTVSKRVCPSYEILSQTVQELSSTLEKSKMNYQSSLKTIKLLNGEINMLNNRIQRLENLLRTQVLMIQEYSADIK